MIGMVSKTTRDNQQFRSPRHSLRQQPPHKKATRPRKSRGGMIQDEESGSSIQLEYREGVTHSDRESLDYDSSAHDL